MALIEAMLTTKPFKKVNHKSFITYQYSPLNGSLHWWFPDSPKNLTQVIPITDLLADYEVID